VESDGSFDIGYVWPGRYSLRIVTGSSSDSDRAITCSQRCYSALEHVVAEQKVQVGQGDLDDLHPAVRPLARLTGEIRLDGNLIDPEHMKNGATADRWIPNLAKKFRNQPPVLASVSSDGHFSMEQLDEGEYDFRIGYLWPEYYIQSVAIDGQPIEGRRVHMRLGQSSHMVVNLATDGASGYLANEPVSPPIDPYHDLCEPMQAGGIRRLFLPDPLPADNSGIEEGSYDAASTQRFPALPPGRYRILAVENRPELLGPFASGTPFEDHEFMVRLAALGRPVVIAPRQHFDLTAPVVTESFQHLLAEMGMAASPQN
jgi:DNA-binding transcriptional LysR family regulator